MINKPYSAYLGQPQKFLFGLGYGTAVAATPHSFLEWALAQLFHVYAATAKVAFSPRPGLMPSS
jgi:hypothetical protein